MPLLLFLIVRAAYATVQQRGSEMQGIELPSSPHILRICMLRQFSVHMSHQAGER